MSVHYTYFDSFGLHHQDAQKLCAAVIIGCGLLFFGARAASRISAKREGSVADYVVPAEKLSLSGALDVVMDTFVNFQDSILGKENRKYLPLTATIFLFIFLSNMIGLIPGVPAATTTVWVTAAIGLVIFFSFNYAGIRENGFWGYIKHFAGPVWWLAFLIFPIEIFGVVLRILTLSLRLYWNISADHIVMGIFTDITYFAPVIFYALATFVCFMQAFVPTVLTMIYILLATQHGEEEEQH